MPTGLCERCGYELPEAGGVTGGAHEFCPECGVRVRVVGPPEAFSAQLWRVVRSPLMWQAATLAVYLVGAGLCRWSGMRRSEVSVVFAVLVMLGWTASLVFGVGMVARGVDDAMERAPRPERFSVGWRLGLAAGVALLAAFAAGSALVRVLDTRYGFSLADFS